MKGIYCSSILTAPNFADVQKGVASLIKDKILIGHSISTDLKVLHGIYLAWLPCPCILLSIGLNFAETIDVWPLSV